jgi:hypothetical protein
MNKRFRERVDEALFEQRGWRWALSRFAVNAWGGGGKEDMLSEEVLF